MSTTQHPGLTPEQNTWLMQNVGRAEEELLWRDVFARLHKLEEARKPAPVMPHAERPEPAPAQPHPPTSSPCDIPGMCAKMNRKCDDCDPLPHADRPEWWHKLNAASPEIAARAARAVAEQENGWTPFLVTAFYWRRTIEGGDFWNDVSEFLNGRRPDLPSLPVENEQEDELTRLRAEVERLTKERDEAREQGRQEGHKEAREGIAAGIMLFHDKRMEQSKCEHLALHVRAACLENVAGLAVAADIARNWQPVTATKGGAK